MIASQRLAASSATGAGSPTSPRTEWTPAANSVEVGDPGQLLGDLPKPPAGLLVASAGHGLDLGGRAARLLEAVGAEELPARDARRGRREELRQGALVGALCEQQIGHAHHGRERE